MNKVALKAHYMSEKKPNQEKSFKFRSRCNTQFSIESEYFQINLHHDFITQFVYC